ncbi:MAG: nucleotidyltransferase domain-containing protein [Clostridium sp.]|uniref:nucleotidyltransferase domain-containing protein n=1 Tax=Clostridium sp. TaxID=1506 RepID=UPI003D6C8CD2
MEDKLIYSVKEYLMKKYSCHSIILYGSFANEDYTEESDIDLVCFCDNPEKENDTTVFNNRRLDVWFYKTEMMDSCNQFLHVRGGKILLDEKKLCTNFLNGIDKKFINGPKQLTLDEKNFLKNWLQKMLRRAEKGDIEGNFRYHWMLTDALEIYFNIKDRWYLGPKKSLQWLHNNDKEAYYVFNNALRVNTDFTEIEKLIQFIVAS